MDTIQCPVCNESHEIGDFCPKCGFESRLYSQEPSEAIIRYERRRIAAAKKVWDELVALRNRSAKENATAHKQIEELQADLSRANDMIADLKDRHATDSRQQSQKIRELQNQLSTAESHLRTKESELKIKESQLRETEKKAESSTLPFGFTVSKEHDFIGILNANSQRAGSGVSKDANGIVYMGDWKFGMKTGLGMQTEPNGKRYAGEFRMNRVHGIGITINPDGSRFAGEWKSGKKNGGGMIVKPNGEKMFAHYNGEVDSSSSGAYFLQDGSIICGRMTDLGPTGQCIRYYSDGSIEQETWRNGLKI